MRKAPQHLSKTAQDWYKRISIEYDLVDEAGQLLLQTAMESYDRMAQAQAAILTDGPMVKDRFEQNRAHPLLAVEKDSRAAMLVALKQLNLDIEPLKGIGRPGGS